MNPFKRTYQQLFAAFSIKDTSTFIEHLNHCIAIDEFYTLKKIYQEDILYSPFFLDLNPEHFVCSSDYHGLFHFLQWANMEARNATTFLGGLSKRQILQGIANHLEKQNAEIKYNDHWGEKYLNTPYEEAEIRRQMLYQNESSIKLAKILEWFWHKAPDQDQKDLFISSAIEDKFKNVFEKITPLVESNEIIQFHLYMGFPIQTDLERKKIIQLPPENKEAKDFMYSEYLGNFKGRGFARILYESGKLEFFMKSRKVLSDPASAVKPREFWQAKPQTEEEGRLFGEFMMVDSRADLIYEEELKFFQLHYLPKGQTPTLTLADNTQLDVSKALRVAAWLKALSRIHIENIDKSYDKNAQYYTQTSSTSWEQFQIGRIARKHKGNRQFILDSIQELHTPEASEAQDYIIRQAKNKIENTLCLIRKDLSLLVNGFRWWYQWEAQEIEAILDIFIYQPKENKPWNMPLFQIEKQLYWLPNMFAFQSASEIMMKNLIGSKLINIHQLQTQIFEKALNNLFRFSGYHTLPTKKKEFFSSHGQKLGDFDVLAYREGVLFHFELKLTFDRESLKERYNWNRNALKKGGEQLKKGRDWILENTEIIKDNLGLGVADSIHSVHSYLLSNTTDFDYEEYNGFRKISTIELFSLLLNVEPQLSEETDWIRYRILEIFEQHPRLVGPKGFKEWAEGKQGIDLDEALPRMRKFVNYYTQPLWPEGRVAPNRLAQYLDSGWIFRDIQWHKVSISFFKVEAGEWGLIRPGISLGASLGYLTEE